MNPQLEWNRTEKHSTRHLTVLDLFDEQVVARPEATALRDHRGQTWSYAELDRWTSDAAELLRSAGVRTGEPVALVIDRSAVGSALLLAALRAGAQYVPLDLRWPVDRLVSLIDQLSIRHIACDQGALKIAQDVQWHSERSINMVCPEPRPSTVGSSDDVIDLFEELALEDDPLVANGFVVRGDEDFTVTDMGVYHRRVRSLLEPLAADGDLRLIDVGCGPGTLTAGIADLTTSVVCVDPSYECVRRTTDTLTARGASAIGEVADLFELGPEVLGDRTVALLASVAQFLPDLETFVDGVAHLARGMTGNTGSRHIVVADLLPPEAADGSLLGVPRALVRSLPTLIPQVTDVTLHERDEGHPLLRQRYDAVLTLGPAHSPQQPLVHRSIDADKPTPWLPPSPEHLAYAIFTSGTTGIPKAVQIDHRSLTGLVEWMRDEHSIGSHDTVLFTTAFSFDLSVFDTLGMWALGGTVRVASREELDEPTELIDVLAAEDITVWDSAPAALQMLLPFLELHETTVSTTLRRVMLSGDWVPLTITDQIRDAFPHAEVLALGGATECTVWSNSYPIVKLDPRWPSVPYGRPMPNSRYYVVDTDGTLTEPGVEGDLFIAGPCVAVDYAHSPVTTAGKFGPDPFSDRPGERMYATGDRAAWLPEGLVQFRGRRDDQVKIRGYRIELGEIQATAVAAGVTDAVAITHATTHEQSLALFYVDPELSPEDVTERLSRLLPPYMMPTVVRRIDGIPTTTNGKVDRNLLQGLIDG
ncbi:MAG TPA: AMP-binding protein [Candidatus Stackebrandtia excrementipullorum]|nr:AMP-binding protein [Candidatus Stackebrandtia excrementipullorum]